MIGASRHRLLQTAGAALAVPEAAQVTDAASDFSFDFSAAVGGPITKIADRYAAEFQRDKPSIKVTPIYTGTYQDTLTIDDIRAKAKYPFGVAMLPTGKRRGSPTGVNFYLFANATRRTEGQRYGVRRDASRRLGNAGDPDLC